tara:strand:- start:1190 stop:2095 length:906 start_codon:yes stop_codon:yes gene_type:complete
MRNIIIQKESKTEVRQWHFDIVQALTFACIALIIIGACLFFVSDQLSNYLYEKRLAEFRTNYVNVSKNLDSLKTKLNYLDSQINKIEEKDNAIRVYAGMPIIDKDIRKLGVGGHLEDVNFSDNLAPIISKELSILEMNVEKLSRKVNLELASYTSIYNKVQEDINRISKIPSIRPVEGGYLNSTFGYRNDPIDHVRRFHQGQDITVKSGTPVLAPADGVVKRAYYAGGFGNHIKLEHGSGYTTLFAHLSKINVKHGQIVKRGEIIGYTGNTGRSTAPHLHYEIHHNGKPQNPLDYFFSESK